MSATLNGLVNEAAWINEAKARVSVVHAEVNAPGAGELLVKVRACFCVQGLRIVLMTSPDRSDCVPPTRR